MQESLGSPREDELQTAHYVLLYLLPWCHLPLLLKKNIKHTSTHVFAKNKFLRNVEMFIFPLTCKHTCSSAIRFSPDFKGNKGERNIALTQTAALCTTILFFLHHAVLMSLWSLHRFNWNIVSHSPLANEVPWKSEVMSVHSSKSSAAICKTME